MRTYYSTSDRSSTGRLLDPDFFGLWEAPWPDESVPRTETPVVFSGLTLRGFQPVGILTPSSSPAP
jgi:hypothetical protein